MVKARKVGAALAPLLGPAKRVLVAWVVNVPVSVPLPVTGEPDTDMMDGNAKPTEVTVPPGLLELMVIAPAVLAILTLVPAVNVVLVNPAPLPMSKTPFAGVVVNPVPPLATATVPVTLAAFPEISPVTALPAIAILVLVTPVTCPWALVTITGTWLAEP